MIADKENGVLYKKIANYIRDQIGSGKLKIGEAIYSESVLCEKFSASRTSVRKAIRTMVAENLLVSQQGKGTFVRHTGHGFLHNSICLVNHWTRSLRSEAADTYLRDMIDGVEQPVRERDLTFQVFTAPIIQLSDVAPKMHTVKVDGLVVDGVYQTHFPDLHVFSAISPHLVIADGHPGETALPTVAPDIVDGYRALLPLALARGGPLVFVHTEQTVGHRWRLAGFREALAEAGVDAGKVTWIDYGEGFSHDNFANLDHYCLIFRKLSPFLLAGNKGATLLCIDDHAAVKSMRVIRQLGYGVPDEFAVAGFSGMEMGSLVEPALTTVKVDSRHLGRLATQYLFQLIEGEDPGTPPVLPVSLMKRGTL